MIKDVILTKEKIIKVDSGDVMHAMKNSSRGFLDFGEAYFSSIKGNSIKAWKKHQKMTLNLIVPYGKVCFVVFDDRNDKKIFGKYIISNENYYRLTVPPGLWLGFKGLHHPKSLILNIADILHEDKEVEKIDIDAIEYNWSME